jgi:hypothetical protein
MTRSNIDKFGGCEHEILKKERKVDTCIPIDAAIGTVEDHRPPHAMRNPLAYTCRDRQVVEEPLTLRTVFSESFQFRCDLDCIRQRELSSADEIFSKGEGKSDHRSL